LDGAGLAGRHYDPRMGIQLGVWADRAGIMGVGVNRRIAEHE
jgi:hypothetical protein